MVFLNPKDGFSEGTIHNILLPLKEAYNHAIDDGLLLTNPVARTGRLTRSREDRRLHIAPLTEDEALAFLLKAQTTMPLLYPFSSVRCERGYGKAS